METDALITYKIFVVIMEFVLLGSLAALGFHFSKNEQVQAPQPEPVVIQEPKPTLNTTPFYKSSATQHTRDSFKDMKLATFTGSDHDLWKPKRETEVSFENIKNNTLLNAYGSQHV